MNDEIGRLEALRAQGMLSEQEFEQAVQLVGQQGRQAAGSRVEAITAPPPKGAPLDVGAMRIWVKQHPKGVLVSAVAIVVVVALVAMNAISGDQTGTGPSPQGQSPAEIALGDQGIGPYGWGASQTVVLDWLRAQLGPEDLLADVNHAACPTGVSAFATWSAGYVFRVAFDGDGLLGYHLYPDSLGPSEMGWGLFVKPFVGPSEIKIGQSLDDIRSKFPETVLQEGSATLGDPSTVAAVVGLQGFGLTDATSYVPLPPLHVQSIFAGRHSCNEIGISLDDGVMPSSSENPGVADAPPSPQAEEITLSPSGLGDVPFGTHPDTVLSWVEQRLGPPTSISVSRDLYCPSGLIADAQWEGLVLYFYRGWAEEDAEFAGPGFARDDTFGGYLHEPADGATEDSSSGVFTTAEGIGPGATVAGLLAAYPDTMVFDAVKAEEDGSPYGDRPPSFRTSSGLVGDLTGTDSDAVVLWVSGGTAICGE